MSAIQKLWQDQKIGNRIAIGYGILCLLLIITGLLSIWQSFILSDLTSRLHRHPYTVSNAVRDIRGNILAIHRDMKDIALTDDQGAVNAGILSIGAFEKEVEAEFRLVEERFLGDQALIRQAYKSFQDWHPIRNDMIALIEAGDRASAAAITSERGKQHVDLLFKQIDELIAFASGKGDEFIIEANKTRIFVLWAIGIILLISVILAVIIAIIAGRSVTKPLDHLRLVMEDLAGGNHKLDIPFQDKRDEIGAMACTVDVFRQNAIAKEAAEEKARKAAEDVRTQEEEARRLEKINQEKEREEARASAQRARALDELVQRFEKQATEITSALSSASLELSSAAESLDNVADSTARQSGVVREAGEEASRNVTTAAGAAEELTAAISEISRQVAGAHSITREAVKEVNSSAKNVEALASSASRVGEVVRLINDIAEQTNLLALNATIEAARAGEAGKGFAVVASEVKSLASQTRKAIEEIGGLVGEIQNAGSEAATTMGRMNEAISKVSEANATIASAVEQQNGATIEIAQNMQQASEGTVRVAEEISGVAEGAAETGSASTQMKASAKSLSEMTETLKQEIDSFISGVKSA
ncbi:MULTISPECIES: methyl-accepting chemotaxis protein [unclassified Iodidimonas]|uniref:methyl-accepting chemotaxis protein n=1 Tax=unclassified Iodidimonas TaxID=2626145 RepID=UPI00248300C6|nr:MULTISPECIES: methyl-accepting chemotaxis protein [unclassified Iodidimonas]